MQCAARPITLLKQSEHRYAGPGADQQRPYRLPTGHRSGNLDGPIEVRRLCLTALLALAHHPEQDATRAKGWNGAWLGS
jgi:hypothetical protein